MCFLSATYEGRTHYKCIADLTGYTLPSGSCLYQDTGFQGFFLTGVTMFQPKKKPVGVNSLRLRKQPIVVFLLSESVWNTPLVE
jgi:hypothetical protein